MTWDTLPSYQPSIRTPIGLLSTSLWDLRKRTLSAAESHVSRAAESHVSRAGPA
jgi:hypothetical protein